MTRTSREADWTSWMRAALAGDTGAYRKFLHAVAPYVRAVARSRCRRLGVLESEAEDIVQEVLLTIHLKQGTWDRSKQIGPWVSAITRNKIIDAFRRRGRRIDVPLEDVIDILQAEDQLPEVLRREIDFLRSSHLLTCRLATRRSLKSFGAMAGLAAGGIAATFFAANCNDDSPLFVATWDPIAVFAVTPAGYFIWRRLLRWQEQDLDRNLFALVGEKLEQIKIKSIANRIWNDRTTLARHRMLPTEERKTNDVGTGTRRVQG